MQSRLAEELTLLQRHYGAVEFVEIGSWIRIAQYRIPAPWKPQDISIAYQVPTGFPGAPPYGFYVPTALNHNGTPPQSNAPPNKPPFPGDWLHISWAAENWNPAATIDAGSNLWGWSRSFADRLREGP